MVLGIDLGTSNTVSASLSRDGNAVIIPDAYNKDIQSTPSIALIENKKAYVGTFADNLFEVFPDKRLIGFFKRNFGTSEPVHLDEHSNNWFSESVAALVLKKVKYDSEMYMPDGFKNVVITVPAHYNDVQRKSVIEAARLADIDLTAILEEPVAAALSYGSSNRKMDDEIILVYDFGGGTFDITLITKSGNQLHVIAKDGINKLGGIEFDEIVGSTIIKSYEKAFNYSFPTDKLSANRLQKISEAIKIELNNMENAKSLSKWLMFGRDAMECTFDYTAYAQTANLLIEKTEATVNRCLRSLGMQLADINKFILIGGTSSSKLVYNFWKQKLKANQELVYHQPLSSVAKGAALYAASLGGGIHSDLRPIELKSVSTYNIGLKITGKSSIDLAIHRNSPLPVSAKKVYRINPNQITSFKAELCQFWDADADLHLLGTIYVPAFNTFNEFMLEVHIENRLNGTISVKVKNGDNGKDIMFEFIKKESQHKYDYNQQKALVDSVYLNNYI